MDIRLTEEQREILSGRICPYCHVPTEYKNSIEVYGVGKDEPPDVTDTPGVRYAVTESDFW